MQFVCESCQSKTSEPVTGADPRTPSDKSVCACCGGKHCLALIPGRYVDQINAVKVVADSKPVASVSTPKASKSRHGHDSDD